jgi:energy-coupling factor transporter ATP-binding protein EcfA2
VNSVFDLDKVTFAYTQSSEPVLKDVSFSVERGELVGVVGRTASGRSTLLYLLTGVIPQYWRGYLAGEVRIFGRSASTMKMGEITSKVGFVMQDPEDQLFNLFVRDEIVWGLECRGLSRPQMEERLGKAMSHFQISHLADRVTYDLSGGEKQKVTISAIDAIESEAVVFDNPTSQLDPLGRKMVKQAIRELSRAGHTILIVDDNLDDLVTYADRIIVIHGGQVVMDTTPEAFCLHRDEVHKFALQLPQIAELFHRLRAEGIDVETIPTTLQSGIDEVKELLRRRGNRLQPDAGEPLSE